MLRWSNNQSRTGQLAPWWVGFGACGCIAGLLVGALQAGGSWLARPVQVVPAVVTFLPWLPIRRQKLVGSEFAIGAARVGLFSKVSGTVAFTLAAIGVVVGRQVVAGTTPIAAGAAGRAVRFGRAS